MGRLLSLSDDLSILNGLAYLAYPHTLTYPTVQVPKIIGQVAARLIVHDFRRGNSCLCVVSLEYLKLRKIKKNLIVVHVNRCTVRGSNCAIFIFVSRLNGISLITSNSQTKIAANDTLIFLFLSFEENKAVPSRGFI